ncbi:IucA/IucC family siderophore biosynthesis protein [Streptomyces sp. XD-27]|uniref:IucA/IucC family protein n=1 Tax=Streptomyces sp. XD-27 TaxID=3062779 RepID=UPI0026F46061|nr:IucA/IucC family protein [Streptomyces sp. XD-27]WKX74478.1 IucA/IucC family protein [Streptomyces sp. XD-27]
MATPDPAGPPATLGADPLDHPDPARAADAAATENLLRCWIRETGGVRPAGDTLCIPLTASGIVLRVPVRFWSATGWHRFGRPTLDGAPSGAPPVDAVTLAALLVREAAYAARAAGSTHHADPAHHVAPAHRAESGHRGVSPDSADAPHGADPGHRAGPAPRPDAAGQADPGHRPDAAHRAVPTDLADAAHPDGAATRTHQADAAHPDTAHADGAHPDTAYADASHAVAAHADAASVDAAPADAADPDMPDPDRGPADAADEAAALVGRVADSVRRTAAFLAERRSAPTDPAAYGPFLTAEQSLVLGHPLHPTPKSREGLSEAEARVYSPELRGAFPLHWLAVDHSVLAQDSAWTRHGRPVSAAQLVAGLAGPELPALPEGTVPLPLHPWQAREIRHRPAVAALFDAGLLHDLGPYGPAWYPTSSVRTVYRPDAPAMLKLSLALRITNSRRENLRKELHRGVEVHRLLRGGGLFARWRAACPGAPGFDIVRDPAWLAVDGPDGTQLTGLDVVVRHNPFGPADDAVCVAGLTSPRPWPGQTVLRSRLAYTIARLAVRTGRPLRTVAAEWFLRYLRSVVRPILWLDGAAGIALEAHQQNTLVLLDPEGWPVGGRYRDNQGYYFRESRRAELGRLLPGIGERSDTFVPDDVTDERFAYYLGVNNVLGLIGAFGAQRLADESVLLAAFRRFLADAASGPARTGSTLPARLLEAPTLRCKANLLTRLRGLDELVGPVDTQSVYVTVANPLVAGAM